MARRSSGASGGGFVDAISVGCGTAAGPSAPAPRRRGRLAMLDAAADGPITVTVIDREDVSPLTGAGRFRIG